MDIESKKEIEMDEAKNIIICHSIFFALSSKCHIQEILMILQIHH